ncbi:MAG: hypothetical protein HYR91_00715 [Flavobacteriia bacterium]|nr:hypothetical protein [Flavobacteriia bacterium]
MKTYKILAFSFLFGSFAQAQSLEEAIKKTDNERYAVAGSEFNALIAKEPAKADNYYYYGENYFKKDEMDSANMMWVKGSTIDPLNALNVVGQGKYLWYKGDTAKARTFMVKALVMTKNKNAEVLRKTAEIFTYAPIKHLDEAIRLLELAIKIDSKNPESYLILGDALLEKTPTDGSPAIKNYNLALSLNPKSSKGIVRTAKLYQRARNYELADSKYKEAQSLDPTYAPAFRENAELNMMFNQSSKAIENWKKYLALNNSVEARYRFATSLFTGKKYCEAIPELLNVQNNGFNNFYIERMLTYSYFECASDPVNVNFEKGLMSSDNFFKIVPAEKIIGSDYKYKGMLYTKLGKDSLAISQYESAALKDTSITKDMLGEIAKIYSKAKKYDNVIATYIKKMNGNPNNITAQEYYDFGKAYYFGPKNYALADSCFSKLAERSPSFSVAYMWIARCKYKFETPTTKWLAKDNYKKFVDMLKPEEMSAPSYKTFTIEASKYLGDYYINSAEKNKDEAKKYWEIVRTLDPNDKQAIAFFQSVHGK